MSAQLAKTLLQLAISATVLMTAVTLTLMVKKQERGTRMPFFAGLLAVITVQGLLNLVVMYHRQQFGLSKAAACSAYFYGGWASQVVGSVLTLLSIYAIFRELIRPMQGLYRIGTLVFRWAGAIALCLASLMVFGPHTEGSSTYFTLCGQFHEGVSLLTLCLLVVVTFATRPLGLTYRSRLFGATLGLGLTSLATLVEAPWLAASGTHDAYSPLNLIGLGGLFAAASIWAVYFALPEPSRRMITLPTTSPFFFWNRIAEALGDAPGEVAVAGFTPAMFAPAELMAFSSRPAAPVIQMPKVPKTAQR